MINIDRLKSRMLEMAEIGKTNNNGVTRLALSEEERRGRLLLIQWMKDLGLAVRYDDFGNIYGRSEGTDPNASVIMSGSHIDSVPKGGKFDGVLGVLGALEAVESMLEKGIKHRHPIEIVSFTNEEGARFTPQMLGSGAVTGEFSREYIYNRTDDEGFRFEDELKKINFVGDEKNRLDNVGTFIEMHIEQGPVLETSQQTIGVVEGIAGFSWMEVTITGESNHSGTTPMSHRKDSLVTAAIAIKKISDWAKNEPEGIVATIGKIQTNPDIINAVPGETSFTIDIRCPREDQFEQCVKEVKEIIEKIVNEDSLTYSINEIRTHSPVIFSNRIVATIEEVCKGQNLSYRLMSSGAGHDAMYMNNIAETAMIFVPTVNGKSHCEEEDTLWTDIEKGASVLYETLASLAE
ncbi:Zn-dependent hydrolase [Virgibacillus necropolis]|uniref:Zn-dependent hydrolase n=1 Tax=Virgibacillus necropolis TaxID=163877 RepID=A0A221M9N7_9BACI|nr:Zn-dependent hydrolase [Virgibacillus necropolis]ASN04355.1 Zn-dependent hydrolase [Virgibacillus necropolis]